MTYSVRAPKSSSRRAVREAQPVSSPPPQVEAAPEAPRSVGIQFEPQRLEAFHSMQEHARTGFANNLQDVVAHLRAAEEAALVGASFAGSLGEMNDREALLALARGLGEKALRVEELAR